MNKYQYTIFKNEVKKVKKGPIEFQLKMRQKHGYWVILSLLAWFFDLRSDYFKKEGKKVNYEPKSF